jgi:SAM-dependent methyltransferase
MGDLSERTIRDFGSQWTKHRDSEGRYGSLAFFEDIVGPLVDVEELEGKRVAEIGSGTGRIVHMLLASNVEHVTAIEPSDAYDVLKENLAVRAELQDRVSTLHIRGDEFVSERPLDYVFSIGVLHHIPDPAPVVKSAFDALKPGGKCFVWLYGHEGNESYLRWAKPLRAITTRLPHLALTGVVYAFYAALVLYRQLCRLVSLPLKGYVENVLWTVTPQKRRLVIYDQLNPSYSKYYTKDEAERLLTDAGFEDLRIYHRHGYSWSVIGVKPSTYGAEYP